MSQFGEDDDIAHAVVQRFNDEHYPFSESELTKSHEVCKSHEESTFHFTFIVLGKFQRSPYAFDIFPPLSPIWVHKGWT